MRNERKLNKIYLRMLADILAVAIMCAGTGMSGLATEITTVEQTTSGASAEAVTNESSTGSSESDGPGSGSLEGELAGESTEGAEETTASGENQTDATESGESTTGTEADTSGSGDLATEASTEAPTDAPTEAPTDAPTEAPTDAPTEPPTEEVYVERSAIISSDGTPVNVRTGPGTSFGYVSGSLPDKTLVTIIGEEIATDGAKWYQIRYTYNGKLLEGYMHSTYLIYDSYIGIPQDKLPSFQELLKDFPESYHEQLLALYDMYPNWKFVAVKTGLDWYDSLGVQSENWKSLVSMTAISSWKSTLDTAYDWNTSTWYGLDGPKWAMASRGIVAHYMDPRNYLNGSMIFAFITHAYEPGVQTIEGVRAIMAGTFMEKDFVDEDGKTYSYAEVLMEVAEQCQVSPYVLAASIRLEIGMEGTSASISGKEVGYEGLYNYFNVQAFAEGDLSPNQRGLWWAGGEGKGNTSYGRPWNSRYKAILGGATYYANNYVKRGQNTLYLKRFNVTPNNTYNHQYMTAIHGAASEAHAYARAYNAESKQQNLVFYIPVYENMPAEPCPKPTKTGSPNNKLHAISVGGNPISEFHMNTNSYTVNVDALTDKINLGAIPKDSTAVITGVGEVSVEIGENVYTLLVTAQNGDERTYTVTVKRPEDSALGNLGFSVGALEPAFDPNVFDYKLMIPTERADIAVTAAPRHPEATMEIIGGGAGQGNGSEIVIKVTARDGQTVSEYKVAVEYVDPNAKPVLGSENFTIGENKHITGINGYPLTTVAFMEKLTIADGTYKIYGPDGETVLADNANIGTGTVVKLYDRYGEVSDTYTVVIYGDVNGDGDIGDIDFLRILKHIMDYTKLEGLDAIAADINRNGEVDDIDFLRILKHIMGYENGTIVQ